MAKQPSCFCSVGLLPRAAGVRSSGPPRSMFVLSIERVWNLAWYNVMLNQVTLDKGPAIAYPYGGCCHGNNKCLTVGPVMLGRLASWSLFGQ